MSIYFTRQLSLCLAVIPRCPHCPPHTQTHTHAHTHTVYLYPSVPPLSSFRQALLPLSSQSHSGGIHSTVWHQALLGWGDAMGGGVEGSCDQVGPFVCTAPLSFPALCAPGWGKKKERQKDVDDFQDTWGLDKPEPGTPTGDSIRLSQSTAFCFCYWLFFLLCFWQIQWITSSPVFIVHMEPWFVSHVSSHYIVLLQSFVCLSSIWWEKCPVSFSYKCLLLETLSQMKEY